MWIKNKRDELNCVCLFVVVVKVSVGVTKKLNWRDPCNRKNWDRFSHLFLSIFQLQVVTKRYPYDDKKGFPFTSIWKCFHIEILLFLSPKASFYDNIILFFSCNLLIITSQCNVKDVGTKGWKSTIMNVVKAIRKSFCVLSASLVWP